jgi:glycosyltransferase involved in cell wall biosynthesis
MIEKRLRIAYVSSSAPTNPHAWSGAHYYMFKALSKHCGHVVYLGPLPLYIHILDFILCTLSFILEKLINKTFLVPNNRFFCKLKGIYWTKKLSEGLFDLVFAPAAASDIAYMNTRLPIVYFSDATLALLKFYYPGFRTALNISREGVDRDLIDRLAISKSSLLIFSSQWAANSSINHYGAEKERVRVIPFGANIERVPPEKSPRREGLVCRLLFLGKDWERKGGKIAFDTLLELEKRGLRAELVVCGCRPPPSLSHPYMKVLSWVENKEDLLSTADFLFLPTRAECFGIVFCEAAAYGVPIISTNTGGVAEVVTNGKNGFLLDRSADAADYAKIISDVWHNNRLYCNLQENSRKTYSERLNWDSWGKSMRHAIDDVVKFPT